MQFINKKTILMVYICVLPFLYSSCQQNTDNFSEQSLTIQPTPILVFKDKLQSNTEFFNPLDECRKIKNQEEQSICLAIIKDLELTDELVEELTFVSRRADLNNDGRKEIIVWLPSMGFGGTSGYPIFIFHQTPKGWRKLWSEEQVWTPIITLNSKKNGWRDIAVMRGGGGEEWHWIIIRHNGKSYKTPQPMDPIVQIDQPEGVTIIDKDWKSSMFGPIPNQ